MPGPPATHPDGQPVEFLYVGRFESRKGADVLLAALPAVAAACPNARFTLAGSQGDGAFWREFETRHPELAQTRVRALGRVSPDELNALYRRCSVLVAPSRYESFGLIYAEAMSHGKPVIGCDAGGIPEVVSHGVTGLLAKPGDVASLVAHMTKLGTDATLRTRMGIAARRDFLARFSADKMAQRSIACYESVLRTASGQLV